MARFLNHKLLWCLVLATSACSLSTGCTRNPVLDRNPLEEAMQPPVSPEQLVPDEDSKITLPLYIIEPPDMLVIEALKVVPKPPYRLEPLDLLHIRVVNIFADEPIEGEYQIDANGEVNLGVGYGSVQLKGLTVKEAQAKIQRMLGQSIRNPIVSVNLFQTAGTQQIGGEHLVGPDGTVNLGTYGPVFVTGLTLQEAQVAIEEHLSKFLDNPKVSVDVSTYNSKFYYIITDGAGTGDQLVREPIVGGETLLDAISKIGGLSQLSTKDIWIARPTADKNGYQIRLPVDWDAIVRNGSTATNYQILPGDRIYIEGNKLTRLDGMMARLIAPFERVAGVVSLGTSAIRSLSVSFRSRNNNFGNF